jgi:hypothetical protein
MSNAASPARASTPLYSETKPRSNSKANIEHAIRLATLNVVNDWIPLTCPVF